MTKLADLPHKDELTLVMKTLIDDGQAKLAWKYYYREIARTVLAIRKARLDRSIKRSMSKHQDVVLDVDYALLIIALKAKKK